ncbi:MAG TPA: hypothetical protein VNU97_08475 [Rhizomicrobium sp.]|jgi:hypothetical protein|nr:hypothetical protein [Rhizomicrobium sp.]
MSAPALSLRVVHPAIDPRKITEELGLPPQTSWAAGGDRRETFWQTRLAGNETGRGDLNSALRDVAARFAHYRFFVDAMRAGGGRVEIRVAGATATPDADIANVLRDLGIALVFS